MTLIRNSYASDSFESVPESISDLAGFLRAQRNGIVAEWERIVRELPRATRPFQPRLADYIPALIDRIADLVDESAAGATLEPQSEAEEHHSRNGLQDGFDLTQAIIEFSILRSCILQLWRVAAGRAEESREVRILNQAIDVAMVASVGRYAETQDRTLRVLDRISSTALAAIGLEELLQKLAVAFRDEMPAVDAVTILLREGDMLTVRAAAGLEEEAAVGYSLSIGEGFSGKVAAENKPLHLRSAASDPLVRSRVIRALGIRGLYGVPLTDGTKVIGVAHMGSRTMHEFPRMDRMLFRSMAARASAGIHQHQLRGRAERRAKEVEESEQRLQVTFENAGVGIAHVALDGTWLRLNQRYCEILGYQQEELLGLTFQDVTHPDDLRADLENVRRLTAGVNDGYRMEKRYVRRNGDIVWVELSVTLARDALGRPDYFVAAAQDITAQRKMRERLQFLSRVSEILGSTLDLQQTLEDVASLAVPDMADWCSVDLVLERERLGAVAHTNPPQAELVQELRRRYRPRSQAPAEAVGVLLTSRPEVIGHVDDETLRRITVDDAQLAVARKLGIRSSMCVPLLVADRVLGVLSMATTTDSDRVFEDDDLPLAQELARRASAAIENARLHEAAKRATRLREQILAIVSHDLRNPIGTIDLAAKVLTGKWAISDTGNMSKQLEAIQRSTARASRLISDLLDAASVQAGRLSLRIDQHDMEDMLRESVESFEPLAQEKGIELRWQFQVEDRSILCDRDRVLQVLGNLIGNALKFCNRGDFILVRANTNDREAVVSVADSGPGIPDAEVAHIFDLYWEGSRDKCGTGLGLTIAKGIVESHGGHIWVDSRLGEGSSFFFTLPLMTLPC